MEGLFSFVFYTAIIDLYIGSPQATIIRSVTIPSHSGAE